MKGIDKMNFQLVMTSGIKYLIEEGEIKESDLFKNLSKFLNNDWGNLNDEDKELDYSIRSILVTILLPDEY